MYFRVLPYSDSRTEDTRAQWLKPARVANKEMGIRRGRSFSRQLSEETKGGIAGNCQETSLLCMRQGALKKPGRYLGIVTGVIRNGVVIIVTITPYRQCQGFRIQRHLGITKIRPYSGRVEW